MNTTYLKVPISYVLLFGKEFTPVDYYIKLSEEKYLKLAPKDQDFIEKVERYRQKGLSDIYLSEADFRDVFNTIKNKLHGQQYLNQAAAKMQKMELLHNSFSMAREHLEKIGVSEEVIEVCKDINVQALKMAKEQGNVFKFFLEFKKNCEEEFLKSVLISHLVILMVERFPWSSNAIKEKAALASLLCDITLKKKDFDDLHSHLRDGAELPSHIANHPLQISSILAAKRNCIPQETLTIIEQHHEKPDGSGFPHHLGHQRIMPLSAIFIIASSFMDELLLTNFDYEKRVEIMNKVYTRYHQGVFDKAYAALNSVVNA